jgi:hypothetical protein
MMMSSLSFVSILSVLGAAGAGEAGAADPAGAGGDGAASPAGSARPFWVVSARNHPPGTDVELHLAAGHPRLVFKPAGAPADRAGRTLAEVRALYRSDATFKAIFEKQLAFPAGKQNAASLAACFLVTGEDRYAEAAVEKMSAEKLSRSGEPYYSNIWEHALAYDWLFDHPALTEDKRKAVAASILERLATELAELDKNGMALWHGRNQAANNTMIAALAVGDLPEGGKLLRRAAGHYIASLKALQFSEGWPEGASYWIYNRAGPYAVAADCVITALGSDRIGDVAIREVMRKIGLWQVYQFAPNKVFEPYGDSAGSLMLGETGWWELTTDYYARLARDPALMAGADYIRNASPSPYGKRAYYWYAALAFDPTARPKGDYDPARPELWMRAQLPQAMLFGRDSMGVAFFRGQWGDAEETYATFKAGDLLAHHDHYDTGHFGIQRGGQLAPRTGLYGPDGYTGRHRLGYAIQTVAANSLLVLVPGETSAYLGGRKDNLWSALSGGQRIIRPTGFDCVSLEHFRAQLTAGSHLERATITAFESLPGGLDYIAADITAAYNSTRFAEPGSRPKVSLVTRQFLYLRGEQAFVVYDRVETTDPAFAPRWLLHHAVKPEGGIEEQLAGDGPDDGILETDARTLASTHGSGRLVHVALLPEKARVVKIGGPNFNCYVEKDGDESNGFDGETCKGGEPLKPRVAKQLGLWRTQVGPAEPAKSTRFLNVLLVGPAEGWTPAGAKLSESSDAAYAVTVGGTVCVFAREPKPLEKFSLSAPGLRCVILDAAPGAVYSMGDAKIKASAEGVLVVDRLPEGKAELEVVSQ